MTAVSLQPQIGAATASGDNGAGQSAAKAVDGATSTKWLTFQTSGAWLQVDLSSATTVTSYKITSADDVPGRDPNTWLLQGSADATTWTTVDSRSGQTFAARFQTNTYTVASPAAFRYYRLTVTVNNGATDCTQIAEFDPWGEPSGPSNQRRNIIAIQASSEYAADRSKGLAFDGDPSTQWGTNNTPTGWIWAQLSALTVVSEYRIYADNQQWAPRTWTFEGSNNATTWTVLDSRSGLTGTDGSARYPITNTTPYTYYRLNITANNGWSSSTNIREIELWGTVYVAIEVTAPPVTVEASMPPPGLPIQVLVPPLSLDASLPQGYAIEAPCMDAAADLDGMPTIPILVYAPPVDMVADTPMTRLRRIFRALVDPAADARVVTVRPSFLVELKVQEGALGAVTVQVEITLATGEILTLARDVDLLAGITQAAFSPAVDLPATGTHSWRARIIFDGIPGGWTPARAFTVDTTAGSGAAALTWTVSATATDAHLWFTDPAAGLVGEDITVVGHGFDDNATVSLAGFDAPVASATRVPASANATTDQRVIDPYNMIIDPEHDELVVVVPDVPPPGGQLAVHGS